jgi:hypothetical protein
MKRGLFASMVAIAGAALGMNSAGRSLHGEPVKFYRGPQNLEHRVGQQTAKQVLKRRRQRQLGNYSRWRNRPAHRRVSAPSVAIK